MWPFIFDLSAIIQGIELQKEEHIHLYLML